MVVSVLVLVLAGCAAYGFGVSRRLRRDRLRAEQSALLIEVELERRYEQLGAFLAAVENTDLDGEQVRHLAGARSWSKAVRERELGFPAQAAAENALSAVLHAVTTEASQRADLLGDWAVHGSARDLAITEQRICGAVRVYNDNAYRLARTVGACPSSIVARLRSTTAPEPFVAAAAAAPSKATEQPTVEQGGSSQLAA